MAEVNDGRFNYAQMALDDAATDLKDRNSNNLNGEENVTTVESAESDETTAGLLDLEACPVECESGSGNEMPDESDSDSDGSSVTVEDDSEDLSDALDVLRLEPWTCERRHSGDGEEQPDKVAESTLDDDEDKQNPAYIPRKGSFFEHDLRVDDVDDLEADAKLSKKKLWYDRVKWLHDKFDERSQAPKSHEEIVAIYGFDIREDDNKPYDATRRFLKKRISKKGRDKKFGDYIVLAKPVTPGFRLKQQQTAIGRHFCPRRSWPENAIRKNIITKNISSEAFINKSSASNFRKENIAKSMELPQSSIASHEGRKADMSQCRVQGEQEMLREKNLQNDSKNNGIEERSLTKFGIAEGKFHNSKIGRIGTGRIVSRCGQSEFQQGRNAHKHDKQTLEIISKVSKKGSAKKDHMPRVYRVRTICNNSSVDDTSADGDSQEVIAGKDGQLAQKITSSAVTKSQDVRLLEAQESHNAMSRINALHDGTGKEKFRMPCEKGLVKNSGAKKSTVIIQTTMAPEIIPPVTRISTYAKSGEARESRGRMSNHTEQVVNTTSSGILSVEADGGSRYSWSGGEFIPSERFLPATKSDASGRPKRYSSQRQKMAGQESGLSEPTSSDDVGCLAASIMTIPVSASFNSPRPCTAATYYGSASAGQSLPAFPQAAVLPLAMSSITYNVPVSTNVPSGHIRLYNGSALHGNPVAMAPAAGPSLMHAPYFNPSGLLQGPYLAPASVVSYGATLAPQFPLATGSISVQFAAGTPAPVRNTRTDGNPLEVRGGTVYFNPEIQQVDMLHGTMYFNPERQATAGRSPVRRAKAAIPIIKPEEVDSKEITVLSEKDKMKEDETEEQSIDAGDEGKDKDECEDSQTAETSHSAAAVSSQVPENSTSDSLQS